MAKSILVNGEEGWICPVCGAAIAPNITVCPKCGHKNANASNPDLEDLEVDPNKGLKPLNS